ncbi:MAG: AAA family ATPase [Candidatus Omnitrophica bacterium]|nr:AAA family ATPase [Candidatus Omnitrophota bacterium]
MRIVAIANQKGGCGKTTTAINVSAALAILGKKTLLVDLDPQGHSTLGLGFRLESFEKNLYDVLSPNADQISLEEVIQRIHPNHHLVPSCIILSAIEQQLAGVYGREEKLMEKLKPVEMLYDYVIIDCPPNLGLLTFNALRAAEELVIPVEPSFFSVHGLKKIQETVALLEETLRHRLAVRALLTLFNERSNFNRKILAQMKELFHDQMLHTVIHQNIKLREAAEAGKSICDFDTQCSGFRDYTNLALELMSRPGGNPDVSAGEFKEPSCELNQQIVTVSEEIKGQIADSFHRVPVQGETGSERPSEVIPVKPQKSEWPGPKYPVLLKEGVIFGLFHLEAKKIQIAGDFNNWVNEPLQLANEEPGRWIKYFSLSPGRYRYKFIVDGEWTLDLENPLTEPNPYGGTDSVIVVGTSHKEIPNERSSKNQA